MPHSVAGLLLAAGASRRLGEPKQLLAGDDGRPAVTRMVRALHDAGCESVFVVVGAAREAVAAALADETVIFVPHDDWAEGMGSSIAAGARAAMTHGAPADGLLVAPCDMPAVDSAHLRALIDAFDATNRVASAYRSHEGATVRGIPAILPRADWPWLQSLSGDAGARPLLREEHVATVWLEHGAFDLDTPRDVQRWRDSSPMSDSPSPTPH